MIEYRFTYLLIALAFAQTMSAQTANKLWYNKPANHFEEALVLGNGKAGATVFGGVQSDQIFLNDATLWSGGPVDTNVNVEAYKNIPDIRAALRQGNYKLADQLQRKVQGKFSESYAPLGTLHIKFGTDSLANNYYRELDISKAIATVQYEQGGVHYTREYFVSHPDQVMVIRINADKKAAINCNLRFESLLKFTATGNGRKLMINGYVPYHAEPDYRRSQNPVLFDSSKGTRFSTYITAKTSGGKIASTDSTLKVMDADEVVLYISIATSFNGFDKDPVKAGKDNNAIAKQQLDQAFTKSFDVLKAAHLKDYQPFFNRVKLDLNDTTSNILPTDERLKQYTAGAIDRNLEILYFQYGRYLLIASSRTPGVPANLQGIWNPYIRPPWSSNYTMNINAEENYWMAETANLSETHQPFLSFIGNLAQTGAVTAKHFYGIERGWAAAHNSDIWAMTNPVGAMGQGDPNWANWNMGGTWAATHLWEHYQFTNDKTFLTNAYPLLKGAALFCLDWLVKDSTGHYITSPSTSPENTYITSTGYRGATVFGGTADLAMIRECFNQTIKAAQVLGVDNALSDTLQTVLSQLHPYKVGAKGNLQEWYYDWADTDPQHRHQSHLFGLYPGHQITPERTPVLAAAARKTLEIKGDKSTGWSTGWRINLWARLHDGNHAYQILRNLLTYVAPDGARNTDYGGGGGTYPNLFDAHPPFQIDGNFGGAAGFIEMLLQSSENEIELLPALPDAWATGNVSGICARGAFELEISWKDGKLTSVTLLSKAGNDCRLTYRGKSIEFKTETGGRYSFNASLNRI